MGQDSPEVAIIGGGAIGTSVLFHLWKRHGVTDTVLLERDQVASGSTSRAVGGVRYTFSHPENVEMGLRNLEFYRHFEEEVGEEITFRENGYLYVFHSAESEQAWNEYSTLYDGYDTQARVLSPAETVDVLPALDPTEISGSLWAPDCGHVDPYTVTQAMASAAKERGASIETNTQVQNVTTDSGCVTAIETSCDRYEVDYVVNAAGAWAPAIGKMVGVDIPIERIIRQIIVTDRTEYDSCPLVIDREREFYFEMEENGSLLACDTAQDIHDLTKLEGSPGDIGYEYYLKTSTKLDSLAPGLGDLEVINDWAGYQSHTPDGHAILGPTSVNGFLLACGMSGHGIMQAPSVGAAIADYIVNGETDVLDMDSLTLYRFGDDDSIEREQMA